VSKVIILNGPSSAGKTSVAKELQKQFDTPYLHVPIDSIWDMVPGRFPINRATFPNLRIVFAAMAEAVAEQGHDAILDVVAPIDTMLLLTYRLRHFKPLTVSLTAPLEVLKARELQRGDRTEGLAEQQFAQIPGTYSHDLKIDTSLQAPGEIAETIRRAVDLRP